MGVGMRFVKAAGKRQAVLNVVGVTAVAVVFCVG